MYTRLLTFTGAKDIDGGVQFLREKVVPILKGQKGYRGITASADRSAGVVTILSLWETEADQEASDRALAEVRQEGSAIVGGDLTVETFEQLAGEVASQPQPGSALMVTRISMDPSKVDENAAFFKSEIVPQIKANDGFLALRNMINRKTGEGLVGIAWRDQTAMKAADAAGQARRQDVTRTRGVTFGTTSYREILFGDMP
jgi:heme-degrading monooxygenase HmoA